MFMDASGECQYCYDDCLVCADAETCQTCDMGFDLIFDESSGTEYCGYEPEPECDWGFYMEYDESTMEDVCMPCLDNCDICYDANTCDLCYEGFTLSVTDGSDPVETCEQTEP